VPDPGASRRLTAPGRAGILIFMALVDLIAVDFMDAKRPLRSKVQGYVALLLGVGCMAVIAYWA